MATDDDFGNGLTAWREYKARVLAHDGMTLGPTRNCSGDESSRIEAALVRESEIPALVAAAYEMASAAIDWEDNEGLISRTVTRWRNKIRALSSIDTRAAFTKMIESAKEEGRKSAVMSFALVASERAKAREEGRAEGAAEAQAEIERLRAALNSDRTGLAAGLVAIIDRCKAASWIEDGRGCYEWDDERYKEEAGRALRGVVEIATSALRESGALVDRTFHGPLDNVKERC